MEGFYSKTEAAKILRVSVRRVTDYLTEGKLRRVLHEGKVWVPKSDIERFYDSRIHGVVPSRDEFTRLQDEVSQLRQHIDIIKLSLGSGAPRAPRT